MLPEVSLQLLQLSNLLLPLSIPRYTTQYSYCYHSVYQDTPLSIPLLPRSIPLAVYPLLLLSIPLCHERMHIQYKHICVLWYYIYQIWYKYIAITECVYIHYRYCSVLTPYRDTYTCICYRYHPDLAYQIHNML